MKAHKKYEQETWNARKQDAVNGGRSIKVTGYQFCLNTHLQIRQIIKYTQNNNLKINKACN